MNLPVVSYYQIGTALTANHAHGSMMGVYGMLAVGLALFALRYIITPEKWPDRLAKLSFWSLNIGLAWMVFATLLPLGVLQLWVSVSEGYVEARSLAYLTQTENLVLEWMRLPGDVLFIVGGILPFVYITARRARDPRDRHPGWSRRPFVETPRPEDRTGLWTPVRARTAADAGERALSRYASDRRRRGEAAGEDPLP